MHRQIKRFFLFILCIVMITAVLAGCNNSTKEVQKSTETDLDLEESEVVSSVVLDTKDMFSSRDKEVGYDESKSTIITLQDDKIVSTGDGAALKENTITISKEGTYILKGKLTDGQIIVEADKTHKVQIVLDNAEVSSNTSAPIYIKQADKVFITLAEQSKNTLKNLSAFEAIDENNIDSVIYSKEDLTLNGNGTLHVSTEYGHGIVSKDDLVITSGDYEIVSQGHGLVGKDSVRIANGTITIQSEKDGIHSENAEDDFLGYVYIANGTFHITSMMDGIDGVCTVQIDDGEFSIHTGGKSENISTDKSAKAIKAEENITINGGTFQIDSSDDSIHSNGNVYIKDGIISLSSGDDGIHAAGKAVINNGRINIEKSYEGIEGQSIDIIGGEIFVVSKDDGLNAAGGNDSSSLDGKASEEEFISTEDAYIKISGGITSINAEGDGVDSNGDLYVTGGETYIFGPENRGNGSLDYNGTAEITGGIFLAAGSSGMEQNFGSSSTQGSMLINGENLQTGEIILKDSAGKEVVSFTCEKQFNSVLISTPSLKIGETYTMNMGSEETTIQMDSLIYGTGSSGNRGMGGRKGMGGLRGTEKPEGMDGSQRKEPPESMEPVL